jgi:uncharacterized protein YkwD
MRGILHRLSNRLRLAIALAAAVALLTPFAADARPAPTVPAAPAARAAASFEQALLVEINSFRKAHGLRALRAAAPLRRAAAAHAAAMSSAGFFSHDSRDGTSAAARIRRFYAPGGHSRWSVGENILWRSPDVTPSQALQMWAASPPHRRVLLQGSFREVGLALVHRTSAPGIYGGREVTIVVADFGTRA